MMCSWCLVAFSLKLPTSLCLPIAAIDYQEEEPASKVLFFLFLVLVALIATIDFAVSAGVTGLGATVFASDSSGVAFVLVS